MRNEKISVTEFTANKRDLRSTFVPDLTLNGNMTASALCIDIITMLRFRARRNVKKSMELILTVKIRKNISILLLNTEVNATNGLDRLRKIPKNDRKSFLPDWKKMED